MAMNLRRARHRTSLVLALALAAGQVGIAVSWAATVGDVRVSEKIRGELEDYAKERSGRDVNRVEIPVLDVFNLRGVSAKDVTVRFSSRRRGAWLGRVPVAVVISNRSGELKRGVVTVTLRVMASVPVSKRRLTRGSVVKAEDIGRDRLDLSELGDDVIMDTRRIVGQRLRRGINVGQIWQDRGLESIPLVKRGEQVRLMLSSGGLRIDGAGRAGEDGWAGDWIRVMNDESRTHVTGRVDRLGVVHVRF